VGAQINKCRSVFFLALHVVPEEALYLKGTRVSIVGYHGPHEMGQTSSQRKAEADGGGRSVGQ